MNSEKTEQILLRLSIDELSLLNETFQKLIITDDGSLQSRSEFIRRLLKIGLSALGVESPGMKVCSKCKFEKLITDFPACELKRENGGRCRICERKTAKIRRENNPEAEAARKKIYYEKHKEKLLKKHKIYCKNNRENLTAYSKKYREDHKEKTYETKRLYALNNKDKLRENFKIYSKNKKINDPFYSLRTKLSSTINKCLKLNGSSKNGFSMLKFLPYTIQELKEHLEKQFESWMNWNNRGMYNPTIWNDYDQNTWVWNLDHIIPHSEFKYTSMKDEEFKRCWALENLRPYSAKLNILDGAKRVRHAAKI